MKKTIWTVAMLFMLFIYCDIAMAGQSGTCGTDVTWDLNDDGILTISGNNPMMDYTSASSVPWKNYRSSIKTVVIDDGVQSIGNSAFDNCSSLTDITIPGSVTRIGRRSFSFCSSLKNVIIPESVTSIGAYAFSWCSAMKDVSIPNSVTTIGSHAFEYCMGLTSVTMPENLTEVGTYAFNSCEAIERVYISSLSSWLGITFPDSYSNPLYSGADLYVNGQIADAISIPTNVERINKYAFYGCNSLLNVSMSSDVTVIDSYAFYNCTNLVSAEIPDSITDIGMYAFRGAAKLSSSVPDALERIGTNAFSGSACIRANFGTPAAIALSKLNMNFTDPVRGNIMYRYLFTDDELTGCKLIKLLDSDTDYVVPSFVTEMNDMLYPSSLTNQEISMTVSNISVADCSALKNLPVKMHLTVLDSVLSGSCFQNYTNIQEVTVSSNVESFSPGAFRGCTNLMAFHVDEQNKTLAEADGLLINKEENSIVCCPEGVTGVVTLPRNIKIIGLRAFYNCTGIEGVNLPQNLETIEGYAFYNCTGIEEIIVPDGLETIGSYAFDGCRAKKYTLFTSKTAKVLSGAGYNFYDPEFPAFSMIYSTSGGITELSVSNVDPDLASVTIPEGVTQISGSAFKNNTNISEVNLPESLKNIKYNAFYGCTNLSDIYLPDSISGVDSTAFTNCSTVLHTKLGTETSVALSKINRSFRVADYPFSLKYNDTTKRTISVENVDQNVTSVSFPDYVTEISRNAFAECCYLSSIELPAQLAVIGNSAFSNCTGLTEVLIPENTISIGENTFRGCENLRRVVIPNSVSSIGTDAFAECSSQLILVVCSNSSAHEYAVNNQIPYEFNSDGDYEFTEVGGGIAIQKYNGADPIVQVPAAINDLPVISIGGSAFANCSDITGIRLPETIHSISALAFSNCSSLISINLPAGLESIGNSAFAGCSDLDELFIPDNLSFLGASVFSGCPAIRYAKHESNAAVLVCRNGYSFREMESGMDFLYIFTADGQISGTRLVKVSGDMSEVTVPEFVTEIADSAFADCASIRSVYITGIIPRLSNNSFNGCDAMERIILPQGEIHPSLSDLYGVCGSNAVYSLENGILYVVGTGPMRGYNGVYDHGTYYNVGKPDTPWFDLRSTITGIVIGEGITEIGQLAFSHLYGVTSISLPATLTRLQLGSFGCCSNLSSVTLPGALWIIQTEAFGECHRLQTIIFEGDAPTIDTFAFDGVTANVYYTPNESWLTKIGNYGGTLTWIKPGGSCGMDSTWVLDYVNMLRLLGTGTVTDASWTQYADSVTTLIIASDVSGIEGNLLSTLPNLNQVIFEGDKPTLAPNAFSGASVNAYYSHSNMSWSEEDLLNYGGSVAWQVYCTHSGASLDLYEAVHYNEIPVADCTTDGCKEHWKCSVCGLAFSDETLTKILTDEKRIIPAPGHSLVLVKGCAATCTETGLSDKIFCEVCNETIQEQEEIPMLPHTDIVYTAAVEPTCSTVGHTEGHRCAVCGEILIASRELEKLPHTDVISLEALEPDCTEEGHTERHICEVCGEILTESEAIPALGHDWEEPIYIWTEDNSSVTARRICDRNAEHSYEKTVAVRCIVTVPPTQTTEGEWKYVSVSFDYEAFEVQEKAGDMIPALDALDVLTLPGDVTEIKDEAFMNLTCQAVIIRDGCISIGNKAFMNCKDLMYIRIPESIKSFPSDAFAGCPNIIIDWAGY